MFVWPAVSGIPYGIRNGEGPPAGVDALGVGVPPVVGKKRTARFEVRAGDVTE